MDFPPLLSQLLNMALSKKGEEESIIRKAYEIDGKIRRELGHESAGLNEGISYALASKGTIQLHYGEGKSQEIDARDGFNPDELAAIRATLGKNLQIEEADVTVVEDKGPDHTPPKDTVQQESGTTIAGVRS